jgi:hypothetical protein
VDPPQRSSSCEAGGLCVRLRVGAVGCSVAARADQAAGRTITVSAAPATSIALAASFVPEADLLYPCTSRRAREGEGGLQLQSIVAVSPQ